MAKNKLKYLTEIREKYGVILTPENYQDIILKTVTPSLSEYFRNYMQENEVNFEWGCYMFLFIKADEERDTDNIEKYYGKLKKYPPNYLTETALGDLKLEYYGELFEAQEKYLLALKLRPNDPDSYYNLGRVYYYLGCFNKSILYYEKALLNSHNSSNPKECRAKCLYNIGVYKVNLEGKYREARLLFKKALKEKPDYKLAKEALRKIRWS